jgi:hypothetical protein
MMRLLQGVWRFNELHTHHFAGVVGRYASVEPCLRFVLPFRTKIDPYAMVVNGFQFPFKSGVGSLTVAFTG